MHNERMGGTPSEKKTCPSSRPVAALFRRPSVLVSILLVAFLCFNNLILSRVRLHTTSNETLAILELAVAAAGAQATSFHEKIKELTVLVGCNHTNINDNNSTDGWSQSHCLQAAASRMNSQRQADEAAATKLLLLLGNRTNDPIYYNIDLIDHHPALVPLVPEYQPLPEWTQQNILPDISIVGLPKAGTSQLFYILTHHPDATPFCARGDKEYCMRLQERFLKKDWWTKAPEHDSRRVKLQKSLHEWHETLYQQYVTRNRNNKSDNNAKQMTVNACLNDQELWLSLHYLNSTVASASLVQTSHGNKQDDNNSNNSQQQRKYILLLRDPADWLWAAWNFWVDGGLDTKIDTLGHWAVSDLHYRSPELFHELVLSAHKTKAGNRLVNGLRRQSVVNGRRLAGLVGRDNVLFLRNEDMLPAVVERPGGLLDRLGNFSGLDRTLFRGDGLRTIRNCNDIKGIKSKCGNRTSSAYEIAGHREMLESTRSLIYLHFRQECQIWAQEFGVVYPDCLNADTIQRE